MGTRFQGTEEEIRALNAFIALCRTHETFMSKVVRGADATGLTISQIWVMDALIHVGPMNQRELGKKLLKSSGNITMVVDNLERMGLVERNRNPQDRRSMVVSLTKKGRKKVLDEFPEYVTRIKKKMDILSPEELETLFQLLRKLGTSI